MISSKIIGPIRTDQGLHHIVEDISAMGRPSCRQQEGCRGYISFNDISGAAVFLSCMMGCSMRFCQPKSKHDRYLPASVTSS